MALPIMLTHDGRTQSLEAWALEIGITPQAFGYRLRSGWPDAELFRHKSEGRRHAVGKVARQLGRPPISLTLGDETKSVAEWSVDLGLPAKTIYDRLRVGDDAARALRPLTPSRHMLTHGGRTMSARDWARALGVTESAVSRRRARFGDTDDRVFSAGHRRPSHEARARQARRYAHDGRSLTVKEWAAALGISPASFRSRLRRGLAPELLFRAGTLPATTPRRMLTHEGRTMSLPQWARELGITKIGLYNRLQRGLTGDRLFHRGPLGKGGRRPKKGGGDARQD